MEMVKKKITFCCYNKKNLNEKFDEKIQNMQKKFGESRIPEGIWSVETIRHTRGSKKNGRKNQITT